METDTRTYWNYGELEELVRDETLPSMIVDLDLLDHNIEILSKIALKHGKNLRVASKSVRVPKILEYIQDEGGSHFRGLMCFSPAEVSFLSEQGFEDLLIAYPRVQESNLEHVWDVHKSGTDVTLMIDERTHVYALNSFLSERKRDINSREEMLPVCIDIDMSLRLGGFVHIGVQRSSIRTVDDFEEIMKLVLNSDYLRLSGVMGYEAQIAGVPDEDPYSNLPNSVVKGMKKLSIESVSRKRKKVAGLLDEHDVDLDFYNAGGTGSIRSSSKEDWVTEVTAGSGFLQSHLFDYYGENENIGAFCFGLPVTRIPEEGIVTCQSGGFIASGPCGTDKAPTVFLPEGPETLENEGYGEVQTPFELPDDLRLEVGDPIFVRPAKAGEIAERFNEYILVRDGEIKDRVKTYRGYGECFY